MTTIVARATGADGGFAAYGGRRGSLDLAINYGYADIATTFVHCPPMTVNVPGVGTLRTLGRGKHGKVASPLDPPRVTADQQGLTVSHIVFRSSSKPVRWEVP